MFELKWGIHKAGECKQNWSDVEEEEQGPVIGKESYIGVTILISGRFVNMFRYGDEIVSEVLAYPGDYIIWKSSESPHSWCAIEDSKILTIKIIDSK